MITAAPRTWIYFLLSKTAGALTIPAHARINRYTVTSSHPHRGDAATCWWADGLSAPPGYVRPSVYTSPKGPDERVQAMTRNVLDRMVCV